MKNNKFFYLVFMVAPLLLLFIHTYLVKTVDDHQYAVEPDPNYAYLMSSIDISSLRESKMVIHPGTTLQMMSNLIMKCTYFLTNSPGYTFREDVLTRPGFYLNILQGTFAVFNIIMLLIVGIVTYNITKKILLGLLIQSTPFMSIQLIKFGIRKVTADVLHIFICLALVMILVKSLHMEDRFHLEQGRKKVYIYAIILGLISGFGLATKVTFFMLLVIPFIILPSIIPRIIYILSTMVSTFIFILPIVSRYPVITKYLHKIFTHKGIYGHGEKSIINLEEYISNLQQMLKENFPFIIILFISILVIIITFIRPEPRKTSMKSIGFKLLFSVSMAQVLSIMIVARHFKSKYLIPAFCMCGLLIYLIYLQLNWLYQNNHLFKTPKKRNTRWISFAVIFFVILSFVNTANSFFEFYRERSKKLKESTEIQKIIKNEFNDCGIIYYYNASSVIFGLEFGNRWTPIYGALLKRLYGDRHFYSHAHHFFHNWDKRNKVSLKKLRAKYNNKIIFIGSPLHWFRRPIRLSDFPLEDVFGGDYLTIYKLLDE